MRFIDSIFRLEEINGGNRCPTYLFRWTLLICRWFNVYLHHFVADDWSLDLHDHPRRFISNGLSGSYTEDMPHGSKHYRAPWIRTFAAEHIHRLRLHGKTCWTLVIVLKPSTREWGFWHAGNFIPWKRYVTSETATEMKSCNDN
jgi:hypothetical protein